MPGKVQRAHHGGRVLAFGDQETDDRSGIDMFQDLRAHHELAPGGRLFHEQVAEIHVHGLRLARLLGQFRQRDAAKVPVFGFEAEVAIDHGADLRGIDAQMDARGAELLRVDFGTEGDQRGRKRRQHQARR